MLNVDLKNKKISATTKKEVVDILDNIKFSSITKIGNYKRCSNFTYKQYKFSFSLVDKIQYIILNGKVLPYFKPYFQERIKEVITNA